MSAGLTDDVIAAVATPAGQGGVGIVRVSGAGAQVIGQTICQKKLLPKTIIYTKFYSQNEVIDQGIVLFFQDGASFTGEEVVEFHGHGSPVVLQRLLDTVCHQGARLAQPGEFSQRAFLNGKIDLTQAEAIADLISSTSVAASKAAMRSLQGVFSQQINQLAESTAQLRMRVEACIDFPDEDIEFLQDIEFEQKISQLIAQLEHLYRECQQGQRLNDGAAIAMLGAPNAGKSSLLNCLSGEETAIVTDIPGTTRDLLKVDLLVKGMAVRLVDTAGLRDSDDEIEKIGVAKAIKQAKLADLILVIIDADQLPPDEWEKHISGLLISIEPDIPIIIVMNKVDLLGPDRPVNSHINKYPVFWISAKQSSGLEQLKDGILQILGVTPSETIFIARARHLEALDDALHHLMLSRKEIIGHQAIEIMAEELNLAHQSLGEIVGAVTPDDLLGRIFSEFCIGK